MKSLVRVLIMSLTATVACGTVLGQTASDALYKSKCQSCHGQSGIPNRPLALRMGIKPANASEMKKLTADEIAATIKNGSGKMKPASGLDDGQVKELAAYFKSLSKE